MACGRNKVNHLRDLTRRSRRYRQAAHVRIQIDRVHDETQSAPARRLLGEPDALIAQCGAKYVRSESVLYVGQYHFVDARIACELGVRLHPGSRPKLGLTVHANERARPIAASAAGTKGDGVGIREIELGVRELELERSANWLGRRLESPRGLRMTSRTVGVRLGRERGFDLGALQKLPIAIFAARAPRGVAGTAGGTECLRVRVGKIEISDVHGAAAARSGRSNRGRPSPDARSQLVWWTSRAIRSSFSYSIFSGRSNSV